MRRVPSFLSSYNVEEVLYANFRSLAMSATTNYVPEREVAEAIEPSQYHMLCGRLPGLNAIQMSLCQKVTGTLFLCKCTLVGF